MKKITIAGYGFVGMAHEAALKKNFVVNIYDPFKGYKDIGNPDGLIVCVSTPPHQSGACNVDNVLNVINRVDKSTPVLIKSTISLEGWQEIKELYPNHSIAFSPEFLRAASAIEDFLNTRQIYMGGDSIEFWHNIFCDAFEDKNFSTQVALPEELILAKYLRNSFLAAKVAFFNQAYDLCQSAGIDYDVVQHVVGSDHRIGPSHMNVTNERGFGGHCFPKDTSALLKTAELLDTDLSILASACEYNNKIRSNSDS